MAEKFNPRREVMIDIDSHYRDLIEATLGRALTEAELQLASTPEAISADQGEVIKALAAKQHVLCVLYVKAIANVSVAGATRLIDELSHGGIPSPSAPWGREAEMGRWIFALPPNESVRRCVKFILENSRPFAAVHALELVTNEASYSVEAAKLDPMKLPALLGERELIRLELDLLILDSEGNETVVERAGAIELRVSPDTREVLLTLSVDIDVYASVTWQYRDNERLARLNAPRLVGFIGVLSQHLHARYVSSDGKLETSETGFR